MDISSLINPESHERLNELLRDENNPIFEIIHQRIEKYGGVESIKHKAEYASSLETKINKLQGMQSPYEKDIAWLQEMVEKKSFVPMEEYKQSLLGDDLEKTTFLDEHAVTLEVSALQFFPWLIAQAKQAIDKKELLPGRFIRVRNMREQEWDNGDLVAVSTAMDILGATWVETLDTRGTDGANIHLGGVETLTGYFGGPGQPNNYPIRWLDEYLYYHTNFGIKEVLNINPGTVLLAYVLYKMGVDIEFKISVFMGNDNPYSVFVTLLMAYIFKRDDGSTPLKGLNFSNSVNNNTIIQCAEIRKHLGFESLIRFEHHITETYKSIVKQPYDRCAELVELAKKVKNISAKHEGGIPEVDSTREHPSDILDYFMTKEAILEAGLMEAMEQNYLDKHSAANRTAGQLLKAGIPVITGKNIHTL